MLWLAVGVGVALTLSVAPVSARLVIRSCGYLRWGDRWSMRATSNLSCSRARRLFEQCSGSGSCAAMFRCKQRAEPIFEITSRMCVRRDREIIGTAGP